MQAVSDGKLQKEHVPKVHLHATHDAALKEVEYKDLKQYAAEGEAAQSQRQEGHHTPSSAGSKVAKEHHEISSHGMWDFVSDFGPLLTMFLQTSRSRLGPHRI